ncbi:MAG: NAD(P)H-dependent flavin oxidoreductase, partial [Cumulibacter sp.]
VGCTILARSSWLAFDPRVMGWCLSGPRLLTELDQLMQVRAAVDLPLIAAGGISDGYGMAGAFALGAEGILMGTRFMSSAESPVHTNWKQAIADSTITHNIDTGMAGVRMRVADTELAAAVLRGEVDTSSNPYGGPFQEAFDNGRLDLALVGCGESATLVEDIKPVSQIIDETVQVFWEQVDRIAALRS